MTKKLLLSALIAVTPLLSFAQGCLTIFSEDGDKFFLVLNGIKQNAVAQTNVRVDGLTNEYYSAKVLFEQSGKAEISKNIPVKDPGTSDWAEVTYKIKRTKDGDLKLRYFSATPVPATYNPPPDMYVVHYGEAAPVSTSVSKTTYTTTTTSAPAGVNMNMNAAGVNMSVNMGDGANGGGLNMNVNINDGASVSNDVTTTTTTTRTTTMSRDNYNSNSNTTPPPATPACSYPMDMSSFSQAKKSIAGASFEDTKLSTAKSIVSGNCVNTDQVVAICKMFSFEQTKLDFAKFAYSKTTDRANYFKVGTIFDYDASKTELNNFIGQ